MRETVSRCAAAAALSVRSAPRLMARVWTVIFSGASPMQQVSTVCAKVSGVSPVRPAMTSMLISSEAGLPRLVEGAQHIGRPRAFCRSPRARLSSMDCGLMLTRPTPALFSTRSFSGVMVSGRPASTVYSRRRRQVEADPRAQTVSRAELLPRPAWSACRRRCRRSARCLPGLRGRARPSPRISRQSVSKVRLDERAGLRGGRGNERAVVAARRAERDTDVERNIVRADRPCPAPSRLRPRGW